jgi:hypothetical protein
MSGGWPNGSGTPHTRSAVCWACRRWPQRSTPVAPPTWSTTPDIRYIGSVGEDGLLYSGDERGPDGRAGTPETRLTERLVERALATGARVSPVEGAARGPLVEAGGIAALVRW